MRSFCRLHASVSLQFIVLVAYCGAVHVAHAAPPYANRPVADVLKELRSEGLQLVYSSELVPQDLSVLREPESGRPVDTARDILTDHGLMLAESGGYYLVVRSPETADSVSLPVLALGNDAGPTLEEVVVSASRYEIAGDRQATTSYFSRGDIESLADLGDDPVRAIQRLPGTAATDASAKSHIRGGDDDEVTYVLDGLQLVDPFHVRDYQSLFSTIDSRAISSVEVYSGGFPARFGDSMSGVMLIEPRTPGEEFNHEIGLSTLEASVLSSGPFAENQGSWLVSLRRGTLDLLLDRELGKPSYGSLYGNVRLELNQSHTFSINALASEDDIIVIVSDDTEEQERSRSHTENIQLWARLESQWTEKLSSETLVSSVNFSNLRHGFVNDPAKIVGSVTDSRSFDVIGVKQDWSLRLSDRQLLSWGIDLRQLSASFAYSSAAQLNGFSAAFEDVPPSTARDIATSPDGQAYGLFVSDRWTIGERLTAEAGLRWDKQTYLPTENGESQLSPRLSVLYEIAPRTDVRASWGKYYQSQGLLQLQIEDGIDRYFPAQFSTHSILSLEHRFDNDLAMRVEAYDKSAPELRSRFENLFDALSVIPELEPDRVEIVPTESRSRGVEFLVSRGSRAPLMWWASLAYSRSEDLIAGRWTPRSWDQRRAASAGVSWSGEKWTLSAAANYHTGWPTTSLAMETDVNPDGSTSLRVIPGERNAERLGSFARVDARVSRDFSTDAGNLQVFVEATNLFDRNNPCCVDYDLELVPGGPPALDRKVEKWLPRVLSAGFRWQF